MFRLKKLLGILIVLGIVFFIICDEKGYKIKLENNHIVLNEPEKKSELVIEENPLKEVVYKNSDLILINYEFKNPRNLRKADGMDPEYLAKLKEEKRLERERIEEEKRLEKERIKEEKIRAQERSKNLALKDKDTISSVFQGKETQDNEGAAKPEVKQNTGTTKPEVKENTGTTKPEVKENTGTTKPEVKENTGTAKPEVKENTGTAKPEVKENTGTAKPEVKENTGTVKPEIKENTGTTEHEVKQDTGTVNTGKTTEEVQLPKTYTIEKYEHKEIALNLSKGVEIPKVKIEKYSGKENLALNLSKGKEIEPKTKNSNRIKLYSGFDNPRNMRVSAGIDEEFLAKQKNTKPSVISLNEDTISSAWQNQEENIDNIDNIQDTGNDLQQYNQDIITPELEEDIEDNDTEEIVNTDETKETGYEESDIENDIENQLDEYETSDSNLIENETGNITGYEAETGDMDTGEEIESNTNTYKVENYQHINHTINISKGNLDTSKQELTVIDKPETSNHAIDIIEGKAPEVILVKIDKYNSNKHNLNLKKGKAIKHNFIVENTEVQQPENGLSDSLLENLLENEEINIDTLESENDEFLQKVFEKTRDREVMNLIVETYLNEYQFVKAKRFIENLPEMYREELKPSLNLRVAFNSFALSSKNINENLNSLLQDYTSKGLILDEDKNRYLGVLALMDRKYDKFFEIAAEFKSENHKAFASKLQGYKDQIAKQMGMPDYYFDTLVSLELFNQGLFQPAKVLALYSLQQNANYILPHQVLAYANFLTNSRDTSIEYLKKLVDIDPTNAEKYRFLMGVAFYWDEKYEQSVVMLSMIKDENLRLDAQRYLINDYLKLDQKNKLISNRNKMLGYENLVASDFYTYFYETFFHPYSQGEEFQLYAFDTELANKMIRVCSMVLQDEDKAVCTYGTIGRNIALGQFNGMEQYLLNLVAEYPQGYLYQALGEYYVKQREMDKAKAYLLKAVSLSQNKSEKNQIKKLLQETM